MRHYVLSWLYIMMLYFALKADKPAAITPQSSAKVKAYFNKWVESNRLCMMIMH
jgi:hypothetical protein